MALFTNGQYLHKTGSFFKKKTPSVVCMTSRVVKVVAWCFFPSNCYIKKNSLYAHAMSIKISGMIQKP